MEGTAPLFSVKLVSGLRLAQRVQHQGRKLAAQTHVFGITHKGLHMRLKDSSLGLLLSLPFVFASGCSEAPPVTEPAGHAHDEHAHHHPETLAEAVAELSELRDTIRDAFAANDPDKAHDPLHEIGHALEAVAELAQEEKLPEDKLAVVKTSVESLMQSFGEIDKSMHGQEGASYKDVADKIEEALKALQQLNAPAADAPAADAPAADAPAADAPAAEAPAADAPAADAPAAP